MNQFTFKVLSMHDVIRLKQVDHVKNEKSILSEIRHPFIVDLLWHHKDKSLLYMLFPYVCGGELFSYLRSAGRFNRYESIVYAYFNDSDSIFFFSVILQCFILQRLYLLWIIYIHFPLSTEI